MKNMLTKIYYKGFVYLFHEQQLKLKSILKFIEEKITIDQNYLLRWKTTENEFIGIVRHEDLIDAIEDMKQNHQKYLKLYMSDHQTNKNGINISSRFLLNQQPIPLVREITFGPVMDFHNDPLASFIDDKVEKWFQLMSEQDVSPKQLSMTNIVAMPISDSIGLAYAEMQSYEKKDESPSPLKLISNLSLPPTLRMPNRKQSPQSVLQLEPIKKQADDWLQKEPHSVPLQLIENDLDPSPMLQHSEICLSQNSLFRKPSDLTQSEKNPFDFIFKQGNQTPRQCQSLICKDQNQVILYCDKCSCRQKMDQCFYYCEKCPDFNLCQVCYDGFKQEHLHTDSLKECTNDDDDM